MNGDKTLGEKKGGQMRKTGQQMFLGGAVTAHITSYGKVVTEIKM